MTLFVSANNNSNSYLVPEGSHIGIINAIVDEGTHYSDLYKKNSHYVRIRFELPEERIEIKKDGKTISEPRFISRRYTFTLHEKSSLKKDIEGAMGRGLAPDELERFNLSQVLGMNCQVTVKHTQNTSGETKARVAGLSALHKSMDEVKPEMEPIIYRINNTKDIPESIPDWQQNVIKSSDEWRYGYYGAAASTELPSDLPK